MPKPFVSDFTIVITKDGLSVETNSSVAVTIDDVESEVKLQDRTAREAHSLANHLLFDPPEAALLAYKDNFKKRLIKTIGKPNYDKIKDLFA